MLNSKLGRKIPCSAFEHLLYGRSSEYETCKADSICPQKVPRHFREMGDIHQKIVCWLARTIKALGIMGKEGSLNGDA